MRTQNGQISFFCYKDIEQKRYSDIIQEPYIFVRNLRKMTGNNTNLDLVNINAYTKVAVRLSNKIERK